MSDMKTEPEPTGETDKQPAPAPRFGFGTPGAGWRQGAWSGRRKHGDTEPQKAA